MTTPIFSLGRNGGAGGIGATIYTSAYGSPPAAPVAGDVWLPSDSFYEFRYNGSIWVPWGPIFPMTLPVDGDFAWVNQGTATVDATKGGIYLYAPAVANEHRIRIKSAPTPPYMITAALIGQMFNFHETAQFGLTWRQSSDGKLVTLCIAMQGNNWTIRSEMWNDPSGGGAGQYLNYWAPYPATLISLRVSDDGVNRKEYFSYDSRNFIEIHSVARTNFITADQVGFYVAPKGVTWPAALTLLSWTES